jgi:hypothetical protein
MSSEMAHRVMEAFQQLDETEQLIMMAGVRALASKAFDFPAYEAFVNDRISRYRDGKVLHLSDLETPPAPS